MTLLKHLFGYLFSPKYQPGQVWFFDPPFFSERRGMKVEIVKVGAQGVQIKNIDPAGNFPELMSFDLFSKGFKRFD